MSSPKTPLSEARITAYLRGELGEAARAEVERQMDEEPQWLSVLAVLAEDLGGLGEGGSISRSYAEASSTAGATADRLQRAHAQRLHPGDLLGRFEVMHPLGRGGMGTVYAAKDTTLGRVVALKLLRVEGASRRARLMAEARALARINDPNVITVHDVGEDDDRVYLAMERVDGQTLLQWRQAQPRSVDAVLDVFVAAGRGLVAAHAAELVHRDIKPSNIMVAADGRVLVLDFGLAVEVDASLPGDEEPESTARVGTPAYMSPEQRRGDVCQPTSDEFSFCVALHESLFGVLPAVAQGGARPAGFAAATGRVPRTVAQTLERGLQEDASRRFGSMATLLAELQARHRRRNRVVGSLGLGAVAVITALGMSKPQEDAASCSGASDALSGTWNPTRADAVLASLSAEGSAWARTTAAQVVEGLDSYAVSWTDAYAEACEAASGDAALEGAMRCLEQDRRALEAVARVLEAPQPGGPVHARRALDGLPSPALCGDATPSTAPLPAEAQSILQQIEHAEVLQEAAELDEAQTQAQAALERARQRSSTELEAKARLVLAWVHHDRGRFEVAAEELRLALAAAMMVQDDASASTALHRLAWVVGYKQGHHTAGKKLAQQAEAWSVRLGRPYDAEFSRHISLGWIAHDMVDLDAATASFQAAAALAKAASDDNAAAPYDVGLALNGLGATHLGRGDLEAADAVFAEAVDLIETHLGPEHPRLAQVLNNRAGVLRALARPEDAYAAFMRSRAVFVARQGPTHVAVGQTDINLAIVCGDLQRFDEAVSSATSAIEIFEGLGEGETPLLAKGYEARGDAMVNLERYDEAISDLHRALSIQTEQLGPDHPNVGIALANFSIAYDKMGRAEEAEVHQRRALTILVKALGPEHSLVATAQLNLAFLLRRRDANEEALELYVEAVPNAAPTTQPLLLLGQGETLLDLGRPAEAIAPLTVATELLVDAPASTGSYGESLFFLARARLGIGQREEARGVLAKAIVALERDEDTELLEEVRDWARESRLPVALPSPQSRAAVTPRP